jgi:hypothetical protein
MRPPSAGFYYLKYLKAAYTLQLIDATFRSHVH